MGGIILLFKANMWIFTVLIRTPGGESQVERVGGGKREMNKIQLLNKCITVYSVPAVDFPTPFYMFLESI